MKPAAVFLCTLLLFSLTSAAWALDLSTAKSRGLVGEAMNGYVAPIDTATPEISALVSEVNAARKAEYQRISAENGQPIGVVEQLAARKLLEERLAPGEYYRDAGGQWRKK